MSGPYRDSGGPTVTKCVQQAIEDFGAAAKGIKTEVFTADHQNKPDVGLSIAGQWLDRDGVDVLVDISNSAVALAVATMTRAKDKVQLNTGAASTALTGSACTPNLIHWSFDTWQTTHTTCEALVKRGSDTWYFVTPDYTTGRSQQRDATAFIEAAGGKVLGAAVYPFPGTTDFSSFLLQAKASGAKVICFNNSGADFINCVKQAREFNLTSGGTQLVGVFIYVSDVRSLGLNLAQGLLATETFYWDLNDRTRSFYARIKPKLDNICPGSEQAGAYSGTLHYLKAVAELGAAEAKASGRKVVEVMKKLPTDDDCFGHGSIRIDGRKIHPSYQFQIKTPEESRGEWDYYKLVYTTPADQAFRPLKDGSCPLVGL